MRTTATSNSPFTHLHVASGYSLRYGTSTPTALVTRAAELDMATLALTDRDGLYGAVKFVRACSEAGITPALGVDLATAPSGLVDGLPAWADPSVAVRRTTSGNPTRGGAVVDPRLPRVTVLALGADGAGAARGWAGLCRLVSETHLGGVRGAPISSLELVAANAVDTSGRPALVVLLGPGSNSGGRCSPVATTSPGPSCSGGGTGCPSVRCTSRWSATTPHRERRAASSTPPGCWAWPTRSGFPSSSPPPSAPPEPTGHPPPTCSTRSAGSSRWAPGTWTGRRDRGTCCPRPTWSGRRPTSPVPPATSAGPRNS